jgi:hypothetical protein
MAAVTLEDKSIWEDVEVSGLSKIRFLEVKCNISIPLVKFIMKSSSTQYFATTWILVLYYILCLLIFVLYLILR